MQPRIRAIARLSPCFDTTRETASNDSGSDHAQPHRNRTIGLLVFASGLAGIALLSQLPKEVVENHWLGVVLILYAPNAILFGGCSALLNHFKLRAKSALLRGEVVIARWRVDPSTWIEFAALNKRLNQQPEVLANELSIRSRIPAKGIEVIVGKAAVQIDDSIHLLPPRGAPEVTEASLRTDGPGPFYIELSLYYPPAGVESTLSHSAFRSALRFPIATGAEREAEAVVKTYNGPRGDPDFFHGRGDGSNLEKTSANAVRVVAKRINSYCIVPVAAQACNRVDGRVGSAGFSLPAACSSRSSWARYFTTRYRCCCTLVSK